MYYDASCGIFFVMLIILFYFKKKKKKKKWKINILPHLPKYLGLLVWAPKIAKTDYILVKKWITASFLCDSKQQSVKYHI